MSCQLSEIDYLVSEGGNRDGHERIDPTLVQKILFSAADFEMDTPISRTDMAPGGGFLWSAGDTVGIYPDNGSQVFFVMTSGEEASSAVFDGGGWDFKTTADYRSYYPFIGDIYLDATIIPVNYLGQKQVGNKNTHHIGPWDYMYTPAVHANNGHLSFRYKHLSTILRTKITLPAGNYTSITLSLDEPLFVIKGSFDLTASTPAITGTEFSNTISLGLDVAPGIDGDLEAYIMCAPFDGTGKTLIVTFMDDKGVSYVSSFSIPKAYNAGTGNTITLSSYNVGPAYNEIQYESLQNRIVRYTGTENTVISNTPPSLNDGIGIIRFNRPLTTIEASAFEGSDLTSIILPDSVEEIGDNAFKNCSHLQEITIGGGVKHIGKYAFMNCALTEIDLLTGIESIDDGAFKNCGGLTSVYLPVTLTEIGSGVFEGSCYIESFDGSSPLVYDERHLIDGERLVAFAMGGLGEYGTYTEEVPSEVKFIDKGAYSGATSLGEIVLPEGLEEIGPSAFAQCFYLKSITIPASVSKIHYDAFSECEERIEWIKIRRTESAITAVSNNGYFGAFDNTNDCPIYVPINTLNWYKYGQYWEEYGSSLGENNRYRILASDNEILYTTTDGNAVTLPSSLSSTVTNIAPKDNGGIGVLRSTSDWTSIPSYSFDIYENPGAISITSVTIPDKVQSIGVAAFEGCENLKSVNFGSNVSTIGESAFWGCGLESLALPESLTFIGSHAFSLNQFSTVRIPASVTTIQTNPFARCQNLESFTGNSSYIGEWGNYLIRENGELISFAAGAMDGGYLLAGDVTSIGAKAFEGAIFESIEIEQDLTSIGPNAFAFCPNLESVKLHSMTPPTLANVNAFTNITHIINDEAFEIIIPDAAFSDYQSAAIWSNLQEYFTYFQSDRSIWYTTTNGAAISDPSILPIDRRLLRNVYLGGKGMMVFSGDVIDIPSSMFLGNSTLKTVSLPNKLKTIGRAAFSNCSNLTDVSIRFELQTIDEYAFQGCKLSSVSLPNSVTAVSNGAFNNNKQLVSVHIGSGLTTFGENPFRGCTALASFSTFSGSGSNPFVSADRHCLIKNGVLISFAPATTTGVYQVPDGVTQIGAHAMEGSAFSGVTLPGSLISIGNNGLSYCKYLTSLTIPASVTSIVDYGIAYCDNLQTVTMAGVNPPTLGSEAFVANKPDYSGTLPMAEGCKLRIPVAGASAYGAASGWSELLSYFELYTQ